MKSYLWLTIEQLEVINSKREVQDLLYDLSLLPEEVNVRVRGLIEREVEVERRRCEQLVAGFAQGPTAHVAKLLDMIRNGAASREAQREAQP